MNVKPIQQARVMRALLTSAALFVGMGYFQYATAQTSSFDFSGQCDTCGGIATAVLTLQDYSPGSDLAAINFVSFVFSSNDLNFDVGQQDFSYSAQGQSPYNSGSGVSFAFSGALNGSQAADFSLLATDSTHELGFQSCNSSCGPSGSWEALTSDTSSITGLDLGAQHSWTASAVAAPEIDPASATAGLTFLAGLMLVLKGRRTASIKAS